MPFYSESGKAIIPEPKPKQTTPAPKPTVTVKTKYLKPRTTSKPRSTPTPVPTATKSPLSIKETEFKEPDRSPDIGFIPPPDSHQPVLSSPTKTTQIIKDSQSGITPVERQFIDQGPTREEVKQVESSKLAFVKSVTGHGKENIPEVIRDLGPSAEKDYAVTAFKTQTGVISPEEGTKKIQSDFETRLTESASKSTAESWMKKHGTFTHEGKEYTWEELKKKSPQIELKRYGGEFIISEKPIDYTAWKEDQYKDMNPIAAHIRRGSATVLGGFASLDYMQAGHTGDPTNIKGQQKKLDAVTDKWEYDTTHNIESGNVLGVATGIPAVTNILAPYGMGVGIGAVFKGVYSASVALVNRGFKHTGTALKWGAKATGVGLGTLAVGTVGYDVYSTHQQDPDKATLKALTYGTQFVSFGIGMRTGSNVSLKTIKAKQLNIKQPNVTFKGGYRSGGPTLVGKGRPHSTPNLVGRGKPYTPMKNVVYIPTSPGVVAAKAKVHFERFLDTKSFLYEKPPIAQKVDPYSLKGLNKLFGKGKTTKGILDKEPFFEITKPSGKTTISRPSGVDTYSPAISGKNVLLTKIKTVTTTPKTISKISTISVPTTGTTTFGKLPVMGFSKIKGGGVLGKIWGRRLSLNMLFASESGVYTGVHAHWAGSAPFIVPKIYSLPSMSSSSVSTIGSSYLQKPFSPPTIKGVGLSHSIKSTDTISSSVKISDTGQILDNLTTPVSGSISIFSPISISDTRQILDNITTPISTTTPISISDTRQILDNITTPVSVTSSNALLKPHVFGSRYKQQFHKPTEIYLPRIEFFTHKKKKPIDPFKQFFKGYRERTWKVPTMKDFMKGVF